METDNQFDVYPESIIQFEGTTYSLARLKTQLKKVLIVQGNLNDFTGDISSRRRELIGELNPLNATVLRKRLPWLNAVPLALATSVGMGDRLGLATPGHVRATRGKRISPIFAQQSVRENARTGRKPQQVMDDAMWGVFQTGWKEPWGADADHLKRIEDLDGFVSAGYTFFTIDPGDFVDQSADHASIDELVQKSETIPWSELGTSIDDFRNKWIRLSINLPNMTLKFDELLAFRALVKYGNAVAHSVRMFRALRQMLPSMEFDFEMSVDETATPTSIHEHYYIASELKRLGVRFTSLAPRFVGKFEKGVDYIGDIADFSRSFSQHVAVMRYCGDYKISLHSGSDKFSVYPIAAQYANNLVHLKTAGTSYLEALRVVAKVNRLLFRKIFDLAMNRYESDKVSYHVSAELSKVPVFLKDEELPDILDQFDARQMFHVTFGSTLDQYGPEIINTIKEHENLYYQILENHFRRHIDPLLMR